jgi:hypothetical protein
VNLVLDESISEDESFATATFVTAIFDEARGIELVKVLYQKLVEAVEQGVPAQLLGRVAIQQLLDTRPSSGSGSALASLRPDNLTGVVTFTETVPNRVHGRADSQAAVRKTLAALQGRIASSPATPVRRSPVGAVSATSVPEPLAAAASVPSEAKLEGLTGLVTAPSTPTASSGTVVAQDSIPPRVVGKVTQE